MDVIISDRAQVNILDHHIEISDTVFLITKFIDGISFKKFLKMCNKENLIEVILQLFLSLYMANTKLKFVHFDLHGKNILIEIKSEEIEIIYDDIIIKTRYIVKILDFEYSHIQKNGVDYGVSLPNINIYNENFWMHDVFKFLMEFYKLSYKYCPDYLILPSKLLSFFVNSQMNKHLFNKYKKINKYFGLRYFKSDITYQDYMIFLKATLYEFDNNKENDNEENDNQENDNKQNDNQENEDNKENNDKENITLGNLDILEFICD